MVFFTDVRTGIVHFLKTLHFNSPLSESTELPVSEAVSCFPTPPPPAPVPPHFHHFFIIHDPGSPEKSLDINHRKAGF